MYLKDSPEYKRGCSSCVQQSTVLGTNRQGPRKPPLPARGTSTAPSKVSNLKKINDTSKGSVRALNLPALNLDKVRKNFLEEAELASSFYAAPSLGLTPSRVHSARCPTDTQKSERSGLFSGSLTERVGSCQLTTERKISTSGSLTDRSRRQRFERKSVASGSVTDRSFERKSGATGSFTDRSSRDSLGITYGLSLGGYLKNNRENILRSSKENPNVNLAMPKAKIDFPSSGRVNTGGRLLVDDKICKGDKTPKLHSSMLSSTSSAAATHQSLATNLSRRSCRNASTNTAKPSCLVTRSLLSSRDSMDSTDGMDLRAPHGAKGSESARTNISKADSGSWGTKKLPLQLVDTLEEALAGVSRRRLLSLDAKKGVVHAKDTSSMWKTYEKLYSSSQTAKSSWLSDVMKLRARHTDLGGHELPTSRRARRKDAGESAFCLKDGSNKVQSKCLRGFGADPAELVQISQQVGNEANSHQYADQGASKKGSTVSCLKHGKISTTNLPGHSMGIAITPETALKQYGDRLTEYEHNEIPAYTDIYFLGLECQKVQPSCTPGTCNYGFDDERGDYSIIEHDHIAYRFEILGLLGKGSFGQVVKCNDHKYKVLRAIKLIRNKKRFHQQALIEVRILQHLRNKVFCRRKQQQLTLIL